MSYNQSTIAYSMQDTYGSDIEERKPRFARGHETDATAGCPCDACFHRKDCKQGCRLFNSWVRIGAKATSKG